VPENRKQQARLDPRDPLVLDTRELGRRPGSMRTVQLSAPAPEGLGIVDLIGVPVGAELELDLQLESVMDGVLVTGTATAPVTGECGRCLGPVSDLLTVRFQELFVYPEASVSPEQDDDDEVAQLVGDFLDLAPTVRDAVVLALPLNPLCREDCRGLCATCGERLDDLPDDHEHDTTDARWGALSGLLEQNDQET
jgi:uncharacterized protein